MRSRSATTPGCTLHPKVARRLLYTRGLANIHLDLRFESSLYAHARRIVSGQKLSPVLHATRSRDTVPYHKEGTDRSLTR